MSQNPSSPSPLILIPNHQIAIGHQTSSPITMDTSSPITIHKKRSNSHHLRHDDILQTAGILKISTSLPQYASYKAYSPDNNINNNDYYHRSNNNYNGKRNSFVSFV